MDKELKKYDTEKKTLIPLTQGDRVLITHDAMFSYVMQDAEICKGVVERILGREIEKISYPEGQKTFKDFVSGKGIRLDIYFQDEKGVKYDVEMQRINAKNLEKRSEFYHVRMLNNSLRQGQDYRDLPHSYVIFICTFDKYECGLPIYTRVEVIKEKPQIPLEQIVTTIFVNLTCNNFGQIDSNLANMIKYMQDGTVNDDFVHQLDDKVSQGNEQDKKEGGEMLTIAKKYEEDIEDLRQENEDLRQENEALRQKYEALRQENEQLRQSKKES